MTDRTEVFLSTFAVPISPVPSSRVLRLIAVLDLSAADGPSLLAAAVPIGSKRPSPCLSGFHDFCDDFQFRHAFLRSGVGMYLGFGWERRNLRRERKAIKDAMRIERITMSG